MNLLLLRLLYTSIPFFPPSSLILSAFWRELSRDPVGRKIPPFYDFILKHNLIELTVFSDTAVSTCVGVC